MQITQAFHQKRRIAAVILIAVGLLGLSFVNGQSAGPGSLEVVFLNVGMGDAALLRDANGFDVLIDGGPGTAGAFLTTFLRAQEVDDIDVMVASHAHDDHIGGLITVLKMNDIPVEAVVYNGYPDTTSMWTSFMAAVSDEGLTPTAAHFPDAFQWGEMSVQVLNPETGLDAPDQNAASLVLRIESGDYALLFAGDINATVEAEILARGTPVAADVLKVAYHGDAGSSSAEFLAAVSPADSVISVGDNDKDRPAAETIQRLLDAGSRVWRTDLDGRVAFINEGATATPPPVDLSFQLFIPAVMD